MRRRDSRGPWYLLTGLILGAVMGLLYAWVLQPIQYTNTSPASLRADFKDRYRALIAAAYAANGNLVRARARLDLLHDPDVYSVLAEQAQRTLAEGNSPQEARALGLLAVALGQPPADASPAPTESSPSPASQASALPSGTPMLPAQETLSPTDAISLTQTITPPAEAFTSTQTIDTALVISNSRVTSTMMVTSTMGVISGTAAALTPTHTPRPSRTPTPTPTTLPTRTPTPTQGAPFVLDRRSLICKPEIGVPLIQVYTRDAAGQPVPGVETVISWENETNSFFTGLKSEIDLGYADFQMTPGITYNLHIAGGGQQINDLSAPECENAAGERYWGSWELDFVQP